MRLNGDKSGRIQYALVFQRVEHDVTGAISRKHWPKAEKTWPWILYSSAVLEMKPFSLEDLPLSRPSHYQAQANPVYIDSEDEAIILKYVKWPNTIPLLQPTQPLTLQAPFAEDALVVEKFSIDIAVSAAKKRFPNAKIEIMNHNNPGFDLIARENGKVVRYVEVKGTRSPIPRFHMTETERRFSAENKLIYSLVVVWKIDFVGKTNALTWHDGEVTLGPILQPESYAGLLI